jgi:hypothetical protein
LGGLFADGNGSAALTNVVLPALTVFAGLHSRGAILIADDYSTDLGRSSRKRQAGIISMMAHPEIYITDLIINWK